MLDTNLNLKDEFLDYLSIMLSQNVGAINPRRMVDKLGEWWISGFSVAPKQGCSYLSQPRTCSVRLERTMGNVQVT